LRPIIRTKTFRKLDCYNILVVSALFAALVFNGCALVKLKKDIEKGEISSLLCGYANVESGKEGPIFVVASEMINGQIRLAGHVRLSKSGGYELLIPAGKYFISAFQDTNSNGKYDPDENWGHFGAPDLIDARRSSLVDFLDIVITPKKKQASKYLSAISTKKEEIVNRAVVGEVVNPDSISSLNDYRYKGYWEPIFFFNEVGANIWFIEPYTPEKIPILFIHGAKGAPSDWNFFLQNIDRSVYQPWFFYYPSGLNLDFNAYFLARKIAELHNINRFDKMAIAAHSMGGLVARSFLIQHGKYYPYIKLFVSISTPWGGVDTAQMGVENSPVVVPSWEDVASNSDFIASLYSSELQENIRFYLLFSYKGSRNPFRPNNDGSITMESILDQRAQQEAVRVYGFNTDHVGILNSKDTTSLFNNISKHEIPIADSKETTEKEFAKKFGGVSVNITIDLEANEQPITHALLVLEPADKNSVEEVVYLNPRLSNQAVESIPIGNYWASLIIPAFDISPIRTPIKILAGQLTPITFGGIAEGIIFNEVWDANGSTNYRKSSPFCWKARVSGETFLQVILNFQAFMTRPFPMRITFLKTVSVFIACQRENTD